MTHVACGWVGNSYGSLLEPFCDRGYRRRKSAVRAMACVCRSIRGRESFAVGRLCRSGRQWSRNIDGPLRTIPDPCCLVKSSDGDRQLWTFATSVIELSFPSFIKSMGEGTVGGSLRMASDYPSAD
jgi:hypothetical protein